MIKMKKTGGEFEKGECDSPIGYRHRHPKQKQCTTIYRRCSLAATLQLVAHGSKKTLQRTTVGRRLF